MNAPCASYKSLGVSHPLTRKIYGVRTPYPSRALCAAREGFHESQFLGYLILETCIRIIPAYAAF
jgi:hypothetical protein